MWLELATIRGIKLAFITILLQNTVKAEEQTTNLSNVSSTVVTKPSSNISIQSSLHSQANFKTQQFHMKNTSSRLATNGYTIISKEIIDIVDSTSLPYPTKEASPIKGVIPTGTISSNATVGFSTLYRVESSLVMSSFNNFKKTVIVVQTLTTSRQEISFTPIPVKERNENSTQEIISQKHSVSMLISSSIQPTPQYISHKSTTLISVAFSNYKQSSVTLGALGEVTASDTGKNNVSVSVPWKNSKIIMVSMTPVKLRQSTNSTVSIMPSSSEKSRLNNSTASAALPTFTSMRTNVVADTENTSVTLIRATKSYIKTEVSASFYKNISAKAQMSSNSNSAILSFEMKQPNKTSVLEPSPSLVSRQNRSKINVVLTSSVVKTTEMLYSKISKSTILLAQNNTMVQHSISSSELLAHNYTSKFNSTKEKILGKTINLGNINTSSLVATFHNKTSVTTLMMLSKMHVSSDINAIANRTTTRSHIAASGPFTKMSSNQTHIRDNITTFGVTVTPTILPFYKTVTNRTEKIQVSLSVTVVKKSEVNYTIYATGSTNSTTNNEISKTMVDIKPTSITSFIHTEIQYSTPVSTTPTSSPEKLISQQFSVTIKITSEEFRNEYITSARVSWEKSKEIEEKFDQVFKNMNGYLFTKVLRFFSGSLGCNLIIHTESEKSNSVSVDEINKILKKANNTEGGLGEFVVGDVEEISPEVQGKDDDKNEKKTWGRMPIIVISILAGVCLVLFVMVITQCIQKRHYSHSLADTNEIQEYSPAIQLKYNDDDTFKDEERVPMTTFNQTDIY